MRGEVERYANLGDSTLPAAYEQGSSQQSKTARSKTKGSIGIVEVVNDLTEASATPLLITRIVPGEGIHLVPGFYLILRLSRKNRVSLESGLRLIGPVPTRASVELISISARYFGFNGKSVSRD